MKKCGIFGILLGLFVCMMVCGCGNSKEDNEFKDGYYTAVMSDYSFGWKEYVTICVMKHEMVSVEYNARNKAGFIKSWDSAYMRNMNSVMGIYPNRYTRDYAAQLLGTKDTEEIDLLTGATNSGNNFRRLSAALLESARTGNTEIQVVETEPSEE